MAAISKIAHIQLGDFKAEVKIQNVRSDSTGMLIIEDTNGNVYETHPSNVVIVKTYGNKNAL